MATVLKHTYILSKIGSNTIDPINDVRAAGLFIHGKCRQLFKRRYKAKLKLQSQSQDEIATPAPTFEFYEAVALQRITSYITESTQNSNSTIKFKALDLEKKYIDILKSFGFDRESSYVSRFISKLQGWLPDLQLEKDKSKTIALSLPSGIRNRNFDNSQCDPTFQALHKAAMLIRKSLKGKHFEFGGSLKDSQTSCDMPQELQTFISLLIDNTLENVSTAANTISQLIVYNFKPDRSSASKTHYHSTKREPAIPLYVGLKLYSKTRSKELITNFNQLGICPSMKRLNEVNTQLANSMLEVFEKDKAATASKHVKNVFTTGGFDNEDHDPSSTTATYAYHGSAISITQHPDDDNEGIKRDINVFSRNASKTRVGFCHNGTKICHNGTHNTWRLATLNMYH